MSKLSRRELLIFFSGSAGDAILGDKLLNGFASAGEVKTANIQLHTCTSTTSPTNLSTAEKFLAKRNQYLCGY
ncbi:hypothetical protein [Nostoc sp.]|uniref:hypothetical protein n=1 Tax=Nostoc sp. TaxID=1180 RepID=UPI002FF1EAA1